MKPDDDSPADTRVMGIVHSALRRDLLRLHLVLAAGPVPDDHRVELADHALWMMEFLRHHHETEDSVLYPFVVDHNPDSAPMVARMNEDHHLIEPRITAFEEAAHALRDGTPGSQKQLEFALTGLSDVLLPHLEREELEMMPIVSASVTEGEWTEWDHKYNIKPKSLPVLGKEGVWLLDGLDDESRDYVVHLVPAIPRFLILHVLGPHNRHHFADLWEGTEAENIPSQSLSSGA
jgi:hemerythrin-like domain-containing protein